MNNVVSKKKLLEYINYLFRTVRLPNDDPIRSPTVKGQGETSCPETKWQEKSCPEDKFCSKGAKQ